MFGTTDMWIVISVLLVAVLIGVHIAVALGLTAALGIYLMTGDFDGLKIFIGNTAYEALRDYVFAVIPLFMLMGEFLGRCGAATDLYALVNRLTRRIRGRLAIATIAANAVFAFVTGVSIAAAAAFARIAYPEMKRNGYDPGFSLGCVAGSACLGMLIPPSVLMIVWGVLTEQAIGKIFIAGVIPGLLLVLLFCGYVAWIARMRPHLVGERPRESRVDRDGVPEQPNGPTPRTMAATQRTAERVLDPPLMRVLGSTLAVIALVAGTLGGIWLGFFTPTEGAGVGAALALVLAIAKGLRAREIYQVILAVGRTSAPLLLLLFCAQLYSRVLSMTGITNSAKELFLGSGLTPLMVLAVMVGIWFLLGCLIDSISIILLTVPVFAPVAEAVGFDPLAFAVIGILAIETGLITPPFGILVFTVRAALPSEATVGEIFRASIPYWFCLLLLIVLIALYPALATWLPNLGTALKPA